MQRNLRTLLTIAGFVLLAHKSHAQLIITPQSNGLMLAQKLVGEGVSISNVVLTADSRGSAFFNNRGGTNIGIDSGIVLTNGRAQTIGSSIGMSGDGFTEAADAEVSLEQYDILDYSGDADLAALLNIPANETHDASILEFDFVPLGDSIKFRYVFSSDEYPTYACPDPGGLNYNDAFAFFISGPGISGTRNIALIPGTNAPVTINNINDQPCAVYPQYYVYNEDNVNFTHNGHTKVFTAMERVQPCQTYHLKLVIADVVDGSLDSGVFLEAKSLNSNAIQLTNLTQVDPVTNISYLVEGCATGAIKFKRQLATASSQTIGLAYSGTAINGTDVQLLPSSITIPPNETEVLLNIFPIMDLVPEGIEMLKIYTLAPCATGITPIDSAEIQIRDYDILGLTPDTATVCRNSPVQLLATSGYTTYTWAPNSTLSSLSVPNPVAMPTASHTTYYCTATVGTCNARDSVYLRLKDVELLGKTDLVCQNGTSGQIRVSPGAEWPHPLLFSINNGPTQTDSTFSNLSAGDYTIRVLDASGCLDSIRVTLTQPATTISATITPTAATCSGTADGQLLITPAGGTLPYLYSINNGVNYQASNIFNVGTGNYLIKVKDANGCNVSTSQTITLNNDLVVEAGDPKTICEGSSIDLAAVSNGTAFSWTPSNTLTNAGTISPTAHPVTTTKYYVLATKGICSHTDSVVVNVHPAPVPNAGSDITICYGASTDLNGSGGATYSWSPATYLVSTAQNNTQVVKPLNDITYYLSVTDANGCVSLKNDTVNISVTPAVKMFAGHDTVVAMNQPLQLHAIEIGNSDVISYSWSPVTGLNNSLTANPVMTLDHDITYIVTGRTSANCEGSDDIFIKVYKGPEIYVPKAFTPNGDGLNDLLSVQAVGMKEYHYFSVFNRWGQKIFSTSNFSKGWDGKLSGALQGNGNYIWIAEAVDFLGNVIRRKGSVLLLR